VEHKDNNLGAEATALIGTTVRDIMAKPYAGQRAKLSVAQSLLSVAAGYDPEADAIREREHKRSIAFRQWIRYGENRLSPEHLRLLNEQRDMLTSDSGAYPGTPASTGMLGAYFTPLDFREQVESAMKFTGPMQEVSNVIETPNGRLYTMPSDNDTSISGEFISENQSVTDADVAGIAQEILGSYLVSSKMIRISISLLEDAGFDAPAYIAGRLGIRLGRIIEQALTIGVGGGTAPTGIMVAASQGAVAVGAGANDGVSGANSIGSSDVAALEASVDFAYRRDAAFMASPSVLQQLRAQRDQKGALLFPGLQSAELRLLQYPFLVNPSMAEIQSESSSPAVSNAVLAFGSFKHFAIRRTPLVLKRLAERFAEYRQVAFIAYYRVDSNLLDGGGGAVKYLSTIY
jgi:HK97 family phage major capsid protein